MSVWKKQFTTFLSDQFYRQCSVSGLWSFLLEKLRSAKLYVIFYLGTNTYELWTANRPISNFHDKYTFMWLSEYDLIDSTFHQSASTKQELENYISEFFYSNVKWVQAGAFSQKLPFCIFFIDSRKLLCTQKYHYNSFWKSGFMGCYEKRRNP